MSLWGNSDSLYSTGTVAVNLTTKVVTLSGGTLPAAATIEGAVITITGKGSAVIKERTGNTTCTIINTTGLDGTAISGVAYNISEQPVYLNEDSNWGGLEIYGVDKDEAQLIGSGTTATAEQKKYSPAHAGWVGITTYMDSHNRLRVKTETFVAGSTITGDAGDDTKLPDTL
jgi:hypothetical protein|tara:strand:- start:391 stop:906 length:516 start_codon:yes stop_codon:yes gene_type:complete